MTKNHKNWHQKHVESRSFGERLADKIASGMGSWSFIIIQTVIVCCWMVLNSLALIRHWDAYPFILLNLLFSTQAAYAAPIIMMSQNRQEARDKIQAQHQYEHQEQELKLNTKLTEEVHRLASELHERLVKKEK